ncbi:hypothetical protein BOQ62_11775 [Chryseobacterium sp. CH21]|uniref:mechanosensitive ion channel family protein n=1 Tax=Chryseobacterium sp. CH21 TaxID=713556 RepID=UPI00100AE16A|nr:mechanosensitive ion channel domain-containing protein [Chryseobacterium sp. CH21]RXM39415.1 hypothetical protein BOQ62_11775 [Chryseobacterium sp. CH21]
MKKLYLFIYLVFFIAFIFFPNFVLAQKTEDSISKSAVQKKDNRENSSLTKNKKFFNDNKNSRKQYEIFSKLDASIQEGSLVLKKGIDYKNFSAELKSAEYIKQLALDGVITNPTKFQSIRNVTLTTTILNEILSKTNKNLKKIDKDQKELTNSQAKIDSLIISEVLYLMPSDPKIQKLYNQRLDEMASDVDKINARFKTALDSINKLQIDSRKFEYQLQNNILEVDRLRSKIQQDLFIQRADIFDSQTNPTSFIQSMAVSIVKEFILMIYYLSNHSYMLGLMFLFTLIIGLYLRILKKKFQQAQIYNGFKYHIHIFENPFLVAFIISVTVTHFFFDHPPFSFLSVIWLFLLVVYSWVTRKTFNPVQKKFWKIFVVLIFLSFFANNLLIPSAGEVKFLILLALVTIGVLLFILLKYRSYFRLPYLIVFSFVVFLELLGIYYLGFGNYNFGKICVVVGLLSLFLCYLLIFTLSKILDIFRYSEYLQKFSTEEKIEINLEEYEAHEIFGFRYVILIGAWFILVFRSSYWYQSLTKPLAEELVKTRSMGDFSFTFQNILFFFAVIISSVIISKIVSFISTTNQEVNSKKHIGSWLLLIRIGIITSGIILAFVTAGFPLDRITIILSALGVGIGLGLQSITNNLVSGIILAFEKPVNIGDIIELNGQTGQMKSIGIRSSIITTFDGADVILPNGELLNQNLTNWTFTSNKRRYEIKIGVEYGSDLSQVKNTLEEILDAHEIILKNPEPLVWATDFGDSSINFIMKFWVANFVFGSDVKSEIILEIDRRFKEQNIKIPFPQREITIKKSSED